MATKQFKTDKIDALKSKLEKAKVAVVTEYKGFSVEEIQKLRRALQKEGGDYMVTKNTLAKIAVKGTEFEALTEVFKGPIALAFGYEDEVSPAKVVAKFIKETKKGAIVGAGLEGNLLSAKDAEALKKYFAANAKGLLEKGVKINEVKGIKTDFAIVPEKGGYKLNFGEKEFVEYFKEFLRPQLIEILF